MTSREFTSPSSASGPWIATWGGMLAGLVMGLAPELGLALPPNPQRPFEATTCEEAQARYAEALAGSPLISEDENAQVLAQAGAQMLRICPQKQMPKDPEESQNGQ